MIEFRPATADETRTWRADWAERLVRWYDGHGVPDWAARRQARWDETPASAVFTLAGPAGVAAALAISVGERFGRRAALVQDLWVGPGVDPSEAATAARDTAQRWAPSRTDAVGAWLWQPGPAALAYGDHPLRHQGRIKRLDARVPALAEGVASRPMRPDEYGAWRANEIAAFAADLTGSGIQDPDGARRVAEAEYAELLPDGLATPGYTWWSLDAGGQTVATIWLAHHLSPGVSWVFSVDVGPEHRRRGYGRAAMLAGEAATLAAGDAFLALNVFGHNTVAMNLYDSMGYVVVDQTRTVPRP